MDRGGRCKERQGDSSLRPSCVSVQSVPNQGDLKMPMDGRQWGQQSAPSGPNTYPEGWVDQEPSGSAVMEGHQTLRETNTGQYTDDSGAADV